ncbi:MAG: A/G-specific adenine glycosylase [Deltaproteobacteria bacterium]|nr:A/G-specific adenine glycosylase [Deltaproteobacteria bacterium]
MKRRPRSVAPPPDTIRGRLLDWYREAKRPLPWRETCDPYAIWVSEVMLQQTRVETVIPYYHAFLARFPDVAALADAPEDDVMSLWSGLGYYRRARLLQAGARAVVARHGGTVPGDPQSRRSLPGVGRYTAGAIGSIAFGLEEPVVDGNVARVLSRLDGLDHDPASPAGQRALWERATELVRGDSPGDLNQALMELGAVVCLPRDPRCQRCPLSDLCVALETGRVGELPRRRRRRPPTLIEEVAAVATDDERVALVRRDAPGLFGGLWQLPRADGHGIEAARRAHGTLGASDHDALSRAGDVERLLTHRRIRVEIWRAPLPRTLPPDAALFAHRELRSVGVSSFTRAILDVVIPRSD